MATDLIIFYLVIGWVGSCSYLLLDWWSSYYLCSLVTISPLISDVVDGVSLLDYLVGNFILIDDPVVATIISIGTY